MRNKKTLSIFTNIIIIIFIVLLGSVIMIFLAKKHCEPKIKYGEFPFSLTYKIDRETVTINNTYVCEFAGVGWDTGRGFYRKWDGYVKETGLENVLIAEDSERQIFCQVGDARYYMENSNDLHWSNDSLAPPHLYAVKKSSNFDYMSVDQIKQTYGIEIISWQFSKPIENN